MQLIDVHYAKHDAARTIGAIGVGIRLAPMASDLLSYIVH